METLAVLEHVQACLGDRLVTAPVDPLAFEHLEEALGGGTATAVPRRTHAAAHGLHGLVPEFLAVRSAPAHDTLLSAPSMDLFRSVRSNAGEPFSVSPA